MKLRFFRLARKIALTSGDRFKVGAVLVKGNAIMGMGCNDMGKSHPIMAEQNSLANLHAEWAACRGLDKSEIDRRFSLYVYRARRNGSQGMAQPCIVCFNILKNLGVMKVYYSLDNKGYGDLKLYDK